MVAGHCMILRVIFHNGIECNITMSATPSIDPEVFLPRAAGQPSPGLMSELLVIQADGVPVSGAFVRFCAR